MIKLSEYLDTPTMGEVLRESQKKSNKRTYQAAKVSRLNSGWTTAPTSANYELRNSLRTLRARARELSRNHSHFKKFLTMVRSNVIGPKGLQLQVRAKSPSGKDLDEKLNQKVEDAFADWSNKENCSASGKLSFLGAQNLFVTQLARDGEVLVQKVRQGAYGFQLKFIDVSYLDETFNQELPNGARVIMSVEVDRDDKPVGYYLTTPSSEYGLPGTRKQRVRVPADEIIHAFLSYDDETQARGVTWFHAAMLDAKNLQGYNDGVITSARIAAAVSGMFLEESTDENEFTDEDDDGNRQEIEMDIAPGSFSVIPKGYKFEQFDPKQPTQNHDKFKKSILMDLATGLDVNYFGLAGDLEAVNYSSARVGLAEERDIWRGIQAFVIHHFCRDVFSEWSRSAWLAEKLVITARQFVEIQNPLWRARGWAYVDPQKEVAANVEALENKLTSWTDILAEQGKDLIEHLETLQYEQNLAKKYNVDLSIASNPPPMPSDVPPE